MLVVLACSIARADYQAGLDAYSYGDYKTAMKEWREVTDGAPTAVSPGVYVESHYAIAMLYWQGQGVPQDFSESRRWLEKAAALNHAGAMAKLGYLYTDGKSVRQDFHQAFEWYSKAAKLGDVDGLYNLGIFYLYGWGVEQDKTMAAQYLAAASALGDASAEQALQQVLSERDGAAHEPPPRAAVEENDARSEAEPDDHSAPAAQAPEIVQEPNAAQVPASDEDTFKILDEDWIAAQDPERYTLQVIALSSRSKLETLVQGRVELVPLAIYAVQKSTRPLYVLVQGSYSDLASARGARDSFPSSIQARDRIWIRRFGMVQGDLE